MADDESERAYIARSADFVVHIITVTTANPARPAAGS